MNFIQGFGRFLQSVARGRGNRCTAHGHSSAVRRFRCRILDPFPAVRLARGRRRRAGRDLQSHARKGGGDRAAVRHSGRLRRSRTPPPGGPAGFRRQHHRRSGATSPCRCSARSTGWRASARNRWRRVSIATPRRSSRRSAPRADPLLRPRELALAAPMRRLRQLLAAGAIGTPLRARLIDGVGLRRVRESAGAAASATSSSSPTSARTCWTSARVLFGEARTLYCRTARTLAPRVKGENVATVLLDDGPREHARDGRARDTRARRSSHRAARCSRRRSPSSKARTDSIELAADYVVRLTTRTGTRVTRHAPPRYAWVDPRYEVAHASIVPCCADLLEGLRRPRAAGRRRRRQSQDAAAGVRGVRQRTERTSRDDLKGA